jgi:hypothetical protein
VIVSLYLSWYPTGSYSLVPSLQLPYGLGRGEGREPCGLRNTTRPSRTAPLHNACLTQNQPHQCVGGNTVHMATVSACIAPGPPQESLVHNKTRTSLPAKPSPNPDDAGPIVRRPMSLHVVAGCDRAWTRTISSGTASTAMQYLRPLRLCHFNCVE